MQLDREMLRWQDLFMDIYMDILRQTAVGLEVYYLTLFYRQKGAVQMRQQNRNYYRNLKHYAERGNADEYIIYGSKRRNGCEICTFFGRSMESRSCKKVFVYPQ